MTHFMSTVKRCLTISRCFGVSSEGICGLEAIGWGGPLEEPSVDKLEMISI